MAQNSNRDSASKRPQTVRGPELRKKIESSFEMGAEYRALNHGADSLDSNIQHSDNTTRNRSMRTHNSKK
jgi:hypothetical protein